MNCPNCGSPTIVDSSPGAFVMCGRCGYDPRFAVPARSGRRVLLAALGAGLLLAILGAIPLALKGLARANAPKPRPPQRAILVIPPAKAPRVPRGQAPDAPKAVDAAPTPKGNGGLAAGASVNGVEPAEKTTAPATAPDPIVAPKATNPADDEPKLPPLRYVWKVGQQYNYHFSIEAKVGQIRQSVNGMSSYTVEKPLEAAAKEPATGIGTAFVISKNGRLLTCAHVVDGASTIEAQIGDRKYAAKVLSSDAELDLALIEIEANDLPALRLAKPKSVELGQEIRSVGFPLADVLGESAKITRGSVAGLLQREGRKLIQIDAAVNPGNSGGPVVDARGLVVGMASQKLYGAEVFNVGFCVPSDEIGVWLADKLTLPQTDDDGPELSGAELAKKVIPSVALVRVVFGPGGPAGARRYSLRGSGFYSTRTEVDDGDPLSFIHSTNSPLQNDESEVSIDDLGQVSDSGNGLSLPFLLGPLTTFTVETLSPQGKREWKVERKVQLLQEKERKRSNDPFSRMRELRPYDELFGRAAPQPEMNVIPAVETLEYRIEEFNDHTVTIHKKSRFATIEGQRNGDGIELSGEGKLDFNRAEGVMQSSTFEGQLSLTGENLTLRIPLTVSYESVALSQARRSKVASAAAPAKPNPDPQIARDLQSLTSATADRGRQLKALESLAAVKRDPASRESVVKAVMALVASDDAEIRVRAIGTLAHWDWATKVNELLPLLSHEDAATRRAAIDYLGAMQDGQAAAALVKQLSQPQDREHVAAALIAIGPAAEDAVLPLLEHADSQVRIEACRILAEIGGEDAAAPLRALAKGNDPAAAAAKDALQKMGRSLAAPSKKKPMPADDDENPFAPTVDADDDPFAPTDDDDENPFTPAGDSSKPARDEE